MRGRIDSGAVPPNKFVITKQLTKRPEDYPDARNQPHVQVCGCEWGGGIACVRLPGNKGALAGGLGGLRLW